MTKEEIIKNINREIIPKKYHNWHEGNTIKEIRDFVNGDKGIYIYGSVGVGKTFRLYQALGRTLLSFYLNNSMDWQQLNFYEMFSTIDFSLQVRETYRPSTIIKSLVDKRYLFIDDLGSEKMDEKTYEAFYSIINKRYENNLSTCFTSNYSIQELVPRLDDRIVSRITEMCNIVHVRGVDKRIK